MEQRTPLSATLVPRSRRVRHASITKYALQVSRMLNATVSPSKSVHDLQQHERNITDVSDRVGVSSTSGDSKSGREAGSVLTELQKRVFTFQKRLGTRKPVETSSLRQATKKPGESSLRRLSDLSKTTVDIEVLELSKQAMLEDRDNDLCSCVKSSIATLQSSLRRELVKTGPPPGQETSIPMHFPCYCVAVADILEMDRLLSFEELMKEGKLRKYKGIREQATQGEALCFVSHQWTGFHDPDHSRTQLRLLKKFFTKVSEGLSKRMACPSSVVSKRRL